MRSKHKEKRTIDYAKECQYCPSSSEVCCEYCDSPVGRIDNFCTYCGAPTGRHVEVFERSGMPINNYVDEEEKNHSVMRVESAFSKFTGSISGYIGGRKG